MGKNLKRKECGKGIRQRKDGLYSARCYTKDGNGEKILQVAARSQAKDPRNYRPYALLLETGLRTGD